MEAARWTLRTSMITVSVFLFIGNIPPDPKPYILNSKECLLSLSQLQDYSYNLLTSLIRTCATLGD